jgi:DNA-binding NarL/FixJ family response regulator
LARDCGLILIVDDDAGFRALVAELVHQAGFGTTREAATGEEALSAARDERPALVLLDFLLPGINGFEVCRTLRDEFGDDLPIIFVSGERVDPADRALGLLVGGDDYLVKPVDPDELLARMRRAIVRSRRRGDRPTGTHAFDLTRRELEVMELLAAGRTQSEIASGLVISPKTVASHVQRILTKLGVHSRAQAVALAYDVGLVSRASGGENLTASGRALGEGGL